MPCMDRLSLACALISKEERDRIVESIKGKDGSVPVRTFVRKAFDKDRWNTSKHEAGHVVISFRLGHRLGEDGVRLNNPRHGEYCRGGSCNSICEGITLVAEDVMRLQSGRVAEENPVTEAEAAEALAWLNTPIAQDLLWHDYRPIWIGR
jgi:hypothetical protein